LDLGGGPSPRDGALHPEHRAPPSLLVKRNADQCGYALCPQTLAPCLADARIALDILDDNRPSSEKFLDQVITELCQCETLRHGSGIATPRALYHERPATDFSIVASAHAKMLAHHPAGGGLDGEGLGELPQLIAETEQKRVPRLAFAQRILGRLALSLGIGRDIDEDFPQADDGACLVSYRACGTVAPDFFLEPVIVDEMTSVAKDDAFSGHHTPTYRFPPRPSPPH